MKALTLIALLVFISLTSVIVTSDSAMSSIKQAIQDNSYNGRANTRLFNHS